MTTDYSTEVTAAPLTLPPIPRQPATRIPAGALYNLALKANGTVAGWGDKRCGWTTSPAGATNLVASENSEELFAENLFVRGGMASRIPFCDSVGSRSEEHAAVRRAPRLERGRVPPMSATRLRSP